MKSCTYCGRENADESPHCLDCGTSLAPIPETLEPPLAERRLDARYATISLLLYVGVQFGVGAVVGAVAFSIAGVPAGDSERAQLTRAIMAPAAILGVLAGGVATLIASRLRIRQSLPDTSPTGAAWVPGSWKHIAQGFGVGLLTGCAYCAVATVIQYGGADTKAGPMATMAVTPGLQQLLWLFLALVLAPLIEEPLFRGILYGGYRSSLGPVRAAVITTSIFLLLHIQEMLYFLPSVIGVLGLALAALWMRLRSSAIGPAVAAHFGYNAVIAIVAVGATWQ